MVAPEKEADWVLEQLVACQRRGRVDELLLQRAERLARGAEPALRHHILGMVAALRYEEKAAMRHFENAVRLAPGIFEVAWNRATTAAMFARWDQAREMFSAVARRFNDPRARRSELRSLLLCGRFEDAARLAKQYGIEEEFYAFLAEAIQGWGLDERRIGELLNRVGAFLRSRRLFSLKEEIRPWMEEGMVMVDIVVPSASGLGLAFVEFLDRFDAMPKEEAAILIGFDSIDDGDALARAA